MMWEIKSCRLVNACFLRSKIIDYELHYENQFRDELAFKITKRDQIFVQSFIQRICRCPDHPIGGLMATIHHSIIVLYSTPPSTDDSTSRGNEESHVITAVSRFGVQSFSGLLDPSLMHGLGLGTGGGVVGGGGDEGARNGGRKVGEIEEMCADLIRDVRSYRDSMLSIITTGYVEMEEEWVVEECRYALEAEVFGALSPLILRYLYVVHKTKEDMLASKCSSLRKLHPRVFMIKEEFWLLENEGEDFIPMCLDPLAKNSPYGKAVRELQKLPYTPSPIQKLEVITQSIQFACSAVGDFYSEGGGGKEGKAM